MGAEKYLGPCFGWKSEQVRLKQKSLRLLVKHWAKSSDYWAEPYCAGLVTMSHSCWNRTGKDNVKSKYLSKHSTVCVHPIVWKRAKISVLYIVPTEFRLDKAVGDSQAVGGHSLSVDHSQQGELRRQGVHDHGQVPLSNLMNTTQPLRHQQLSLNQSTTQTSYNWENQKSFIETWNSIWTAGEDGLSNWLMQLRQKVTHICTSNTIWNCTYQGK